MRRALDSKYEQRKLTAHRAQGKIYAHQSKQPDRQRKSALRPTSALPAFHDEPIKPELTYAHTRHNS